MSIALIILAIIVIGVIVIALWGVSIYNGLVRARNAFRNAFAQIDELKQMVAQRFAEAAQIGAQVIAQQLEANKATAAAATTTTATATPVTAAAATPVKADTKL